MPSFDTVAALVHRRCKRARGRPVRHCCQIGEISASPPCAIRSATRGRVLLNPTRSAGAAQTGAAFSARPHPGNTGKNPKTAAKSTAERERSDILNDRLIAEDPVGNIVDLSPLMATIVLAG